MTAKPWRVTNEAEAAALFGHGSALHVATREHFRRIARAEFEAKWRRELEAIAQALFGWVP